MCLHRITERFELEGTFNDHPSPTPCHEHGHLPLNQAAQSLIQSGLEQFQWWGNHNLSGQPVPAPHLPHHEEHLPYLPSFLPKSPLFHFKPLPLVLSLQTSVRSLSPSVYLYPSIYWKDAVRSAMDLLFYTPPSLGGNIPRALKGRQHTRDFSKSSDALTRSETKTTHTMPLLWALLLVENTFKEASAPSSSQGLTSPFTLHHYSYYHGRGKQTTQQNSINDHNPQTKIEMDKGFKSFLELIAWVKTETLDYLSCL